MTKQPREPQKPSLPPSVDQCPRERLWTVRVDRAHWHGDVVNRGADGYEAQILKDTDLRISWRWPTREQAVQWAEKQRRLAHARSRP